MKCPHCEYQETEPTEDADSGLFWKVSNQICLERACGFMETQKSARLMGCPSCKKVFVDDNWW